MTETSEAWQGDLYQLSLSEFLALHDVSLADKQARRDELARVVPKRRYGDGTDTYEDFIQPQHATGPEQAAAAKELFWIRSNLDEIEHLYPNAESDLFVIAVIRARATCARSASTTGATGRPWFSGLSGVAAMSRSISISTSG